MSFWYGFYQCVLIKILTPIFQFFFWEEGDKEYTFVNLCFSH